MTIDQVLWVIALRKKTDMTYPEIAENLPISKSGVAQIANRITWPSAWKIFDSWNI